MKDIVTIMFFTLFVFAVFACVRLNENEKLIKKRCTRCHSTKRIYVEKRSKEEWQDIVERMMRHGVRLSQQEKRRIVDYLASKK